MANKDFTVSISRKIGAGKPSYAATLPGMPKKMKQPKLPTKMHSLKKGRKM